MRAIGFRARMGWTHAVVLDGIPDDLRVVDRREVALAPPDRGYPYHAIADVAQSERDVVLADAIAHVNMHVRGIVERLLAEVGVEASGVVVGRGIGRIPLAQVLASPRLFHTAEGAVYYEALAAALRAMGTGVRCATISFGDSEAHPIWDAVTALRKQCGPPWTKDHKMAAVAAWVAATV